MKKTALFLLLFFLSICGELRAQSFDLRTQREPVISLDGLWRFHTGDNPEWAESSFDDSQWLLLKSNLGWGGQGYTGYGGFAWYRFTVQVPDGSKAWSLYPGRTLAAYQVFVDGRLVGSYGTIFSHLLRIPRPQAFVIPPAAPGPRILHVAFRLWHNPIWAGYESGGFFGTSYLGDSDLIEQRVVMDRSLRKNLFVNEYTYAVLGVLVGLLVLVLFFIRRAEREYLWFALLLLANAADIAVLIFNGLGLISVPVFDLLDSTMQSATLFAALAFFSIVLRAPRSKIWWFAVAMLLVNPPTVFLYVFRLTSVATSGIINILVVLPATLWILVILLKRAIQRDKDALILLVPTLLWQGFTFVSGIFTITWQLGWQRRTASLNHYALLREPYRLYPDSAIGTLFIFALLIFLVRRFSLARKEEERLAAELEAARSIQSLLIPARAPAIPGFTVESVYLPANEVGGDFFQVLPEEDGSLLIIVGDVSGKGLKAAMTVSTIIGALRNERERRPAAVLGSLNRILHGQITGFVVCTVALITSNGAMILANAGNLAPYLNGKEMTVEPGLPLGILSEASYAEASCQLNPGDRLTLLSDGVVEATNEQRELFGFERTLAISGQAASAIAEAAKKFGQKDDISVVSISFAPAAVALA